MLKDVLIFNIKVLWKLSASVEANVRDFISLSHSVEDKDIIPQACLHVHRQCKYTTHTHWQQTQTVANEKV